MKGKLLKSFFSSGLQAIALQVLGVVFLLIAAYYLDETEFGLINWANAVSALVVTVIGFGMEQVVVRRIAASSTSDWAAAAFFIHALVTSVVAWIIIYLLSGICTACPEGIRYLPLFFGAQCFLYLVLPLKQYLNAKHIFTPYGVIAVFSNLCKIALAFWLVNSGILSIEYVALVLIGCSALELVLLLLYVLNRTGFSFRFKYVAYQKLIKESLPQYLSIIFDSSLSRIDWILLGLITTYAATGGYSFAYRAYELARLPIVIIAPIILNAFARLLASGGRLEEGKQQEVRKLFSMLVFFSMLIPITINLIWSPLLDDLFTGKYGSSNETEMLILSLCIPLQFMINLMWTLTFSARKYKRIAAITMTVAVSNLLLNLVLIPFYGGLGAAGAYLFTTVIQGFLYYKTVARFVMKISLNVLVLFFAIAAMVYIGISFIEMHYILKVIVACVAYVAIALMTGKIGRSHFRMVLSYLKK
ncbi:MAG: oligosaccharide flippase family protein [Chitinophagales bacterium]|nr:oligosaccharide flippase family protein [Chitinophagaceae bacterium]MCB9063658.1 oligosaccharide flippase family protein [Chitinophagales bacterium]